MTFIIGLLLGIIIFAPRQPVKNEALKAVSNSMSKQVTHAHRLRLLYEKLPAYHTRFLQAMLSCHKYMQPEAQAYVTRLMNEYNELVLDISDTMEALKQDSQEIERTFLEVA